MGRGRTALLERRQSGLDARDMARGVPQGAHALRLTRRGLLTVGAGLVSSALLAACGGDDDDAAAPVATSTVAGGAAATATQTTGAQATDVPATATATTTATMRSDAGASPTSVASATAAATEAAASPVAGGFPLTVEHALGTATIPALPERIVAINDTMALDNLLAVGVQPILYGYSASYGVERSPWIAADDLVGIEQYDITSRVPDIEIVAQARPDLILDTWTDPTVFTQLNGIAPTLVLKNDDLTPWQDMQRMVGLVTAREAEAEAAIAATEALLDAQAVRLEAYAERSVMIGYQFFEEIIIHGRNTTVGTLLTRLGLNVVAPNDDELTFLSLERWSELADADLLVSLTFFDEDTLAQEEDPLFRSLPAVAEGRYALLDNRMARALYLESALALQWVTPLMTDALIAAAEGNGRSLPVT